MNGDDERRQLARGEVLHFVDRDHHRALTIARGLGDRHEEICQILIEVARIRFAAERIRIELNA